MNFLQKLSKVLPINTDQIKLLQEQLPHITIKEPYEAIEILGIVFCKGLEQTTILNWQITF